MAEITSIQLYLKRLASATTYGVTAEIRDAGSKNLVPASSTLLGTSVVPWSGISTGGGWVVFTFSPAINISADGWYGINIFVTDNPSQFERSKLEWRKASDYDFVDGFPYTGQEQWFRQAGGGGWTRFQNSNGPAYKVIGDGIDENQASTADGAWVNFGTYPGAGIRTRTEITIIAPTLEAPADEGTNYYLNKDWLLEMRWDDDEGVPIADHTLYFAATGDPEFIPRTDRTRYSIVAYKMFLDVELDYLTTYFWFVRKDLGGGEYVDSEIWSFTTMIYTPPQYSTRTRPPYGGGDDITVPTGENNMITVERLIAIARNKFFYEDV